MTPVQRNLRDKGGINEKTKRAGRKRQYKQNGRNKNISRILWRETIFRDQFVYPVPLIYISHQLCASDKRHPQPVLWVEPFPVKP